LLKLKTSAKLLEIGLTCKHKGIAKFSKSLEMKCLGNQVVRVLGWHKKG